MTVKSGEWVYYRLDQGFFHPDQMSGREMRRGDAYDAEAIFLEVDRSCHACHCPNRMEASGAGALFDCFQEEVSDAFMLIFGRNCEMRDMSYASAFSYSFATPTTSSFSLTAMK